MTDRGIADVDFNLIKAIPLPAFVVAADDRLAAANPPLQALIPNLQIGRNYLNAMRQPGLIDLIDAVRRGAAPDSTDLRLRSATDNTYKATGALLDEGDVLICLQDIDETASAVQMRRDFVADLSHELRTPLTAISGILETCAGDPQAISHFLPIMFQEVDRMSRLVTDLLALSRVETNERRAPGQDVHVQAVVQDACAPLAALARKSGVRIDTDLPDQPIHVRGDADELVRAVANLVENAVRYGGSGGVVNVAARFDPSAGGTVALVVTDKGPGVEAHHIPRLTERFYRVDSHRSRETGGSGLGLAIVKHVASHHRGKLEIRSCPGQGMTVSIVLPGARLSQQS